MICFQCILDIEISTPQKSVARAFWIAIFCQDTLITAQNSQKFKNKFNAWFFFHKKWFFTLYLNYSKLISEIDLEKHKLVLSVTTDLSTQHKSTTNRRAILRGIDLWYFCRKNMFLEKVITKKHDFIWLTRPSPVSLGRSVLNNVTNQVQVLHFLGVCRRFEISFRRLKTKKNNQLL